MSATLSLSLDIDDAHFLLGLLEPGTRLHDEIEEWIDEHGARE